MEVKKPPRTNKAKSKPPVTGKRTQSAKTKAAAPKKNSLEKGVEEVARIIEERKKQQRFSAELFLTILDEWLKVDEETGEFRTLSDVLRQPGMPTRATFYRWMAEDKSGLLYELYNTAGQAHMDEMHDERIRVARDSSTDIVMKETSDGKLIPDENVKSVLRSQLIIKSIEWTLSRLGRNTYGNNISVETKVDASPEALEELAKLGAENRIQAARKAQEHRMLIAQEVQNMENSYEEIYN